MEDIFIKGEVPFWVVIYYFVMWAVNTFGYALSAYSFFQLSQLAKVSRFYKTLLRLAILLAIFMIIRGMSGVIGFARFTFFGDSTTVVVEQLGVVSLFLNTSFINLFALLSYLESRRLRQIRNNKIELFNSTVKAFEELRNATNYSREMHKSRG